MINSKWQTQCENIHMEKPNTSLEAKQFRSNGCDWSKGN